METSLISIIIVTYNGLSFLKKCIPTILGQTYKNIEIIIVDNNSSDKTIEYLIHDYPKIMVIKNAKNEGFAKANNIGIYQAQGEYIFLLNNDTELFPNAVEKLVLAYKPRTILTATQISMCDKNAYRTGSGIDIFGYPYFNHAHPEKTKLFYADGAAMFLSKKDFEDIGGFDEKLFMFQEDIDFSWRARIMGYTVLPVTYAKLYHYYGGTAAFARDKKTGYTTSYFRRYLNERNVIRNMLKNYSSLFLIALFILLIILHVFEIIFLTLLGKWKAARCYLQAYIWNLQNMSDTLQQRRIVQNKRIVTDTEIIKNMHWIYAKFYLLLKIGLPSFN